MTRLPSKTAAAGLALALALAAVSPSGCALLDRRPRLFVGGGSAGGGTKVVAGLTFELEERGACRPERERERGGDS